jgi:hypothetical protein
MSRKEGLSTCYQQLEDSNKHCSNLVKEGKKGWENFGVKIS